MKKTLIFGLFALLFIESVSAVMQEVNYTESDWPDQSGLFVTQLRYEPYPVNPGEYFDLYIKAQQGSGFAPNAVFELIPEFPFSLDSNEEPVREYGKIYSEPVVLHYKVRVSKDAVEGTNEIGIKYNSGVSGSASIIKKFEVEVANAQTDFDLVVQDSTGSEVSIAIANTGKNPANSLIVRIPEQDDFRVTGATGQMVGNLDSGDYSIVGFNLVQVGRGDGFLTVEMDYTDTIGERRTVEKEVQYGFGSFAENSSNFSGGFRRMSGESPQTKSASIINSNWLWLTFLVIVIIFTIYKIRYKGSKVGPEIKSKESPEWVAYHRKK